MLGPGQHSLKFFVYLVESPSAPDVYWGRSEGSLVQRGLELNGIPCVVRTAIDRTAFTAALQLGLPDAMGRYPDRLPILHLSAHGNINGIALSNDELVSWAGLRELIQPINASLSHTLLVCMSACKGYQACQMAMRVGDEPYPYLGIVGHLGKPTWSDTAIAYSAFYHLLAKGFIIKEAIDGMIAACGDNGWVFETAAESKQAYLDWSKVDLGEARRELEAAADQGASPTAKALQTTTNG